jgi:hypothetical protein
MYHWRTFQDPNCCQNMSGEFFKKSPSKLNLEDDPRVLAIILI